MQLSVALPRVDLVEVRLQRAQEEGKNLQSRCSSCHRSRHLFPATSVTSPWSVVEAEDEQEEVDEPSHAQRPLAPFLRPSLPRPELWPLPRLLRPKLTPRRRPEPHQLSMSLPRLHHRCHPRSGGGGRHPQHFCHHPRSYHPHGCGPRGRDCRCVAVPPGCVPSTLAPGFGQKTGSGGLSRPYTFHSRHIVSPSKIKYIVSVYRLIHITLLTLVQAISLPKTRSVHPVIRAIGVSHTACNDSFDHVFNLTVGGVYVF